MAAVPDSAEQMTVQSKGVKMRAARLYGANESFRVEEVDRPVPGPGQILVRIAGAGVCHSDLHTKNGGIQGFPPGPWILGHENAGWIEELGEGVSGFAEGDAVAVFGGWGCGQCRFCLSGQEQLCNPFLWGGMGTAPGGYAEYFVVPAARHLIHLGDLDPVLAAPLTDAALTPYHAVKKVIPLLPGGSTAVVIGAGGLGHMAIQLLKTLTGAQVIVVDTAADKREAALGLGADLVFDPAADDVAAKIKEASGGEGAAAILDFVGVDQTLALAAASVGRQGQVVLIGLAGGSVPFSFFTWPGESVLTTSNWGTRNELEEVIALARQGLIAVHIERFGLDQINEAFDRLEAGKMNGRGVLVM
jgi:propanol-preferring alcohol dehydrogenase